MAVTTDTLTINKVINSTSPAKKAFSITPSDDNYLADANDIQIHTRGIIVGVDGNIAVIFVGDTDPVVITVVAGVVYPFAVKKVDATDTTATGIVGLY